jgi:prepilin-type N-terminal cleavage/methylation domain-containing protein
MKRLLMQSRRGEKGFTLIELLIVVAILGILAAVVVPNIGGFFVTGKLNAANTEVSNVKTAAVGFYAENGDWPDNSNDLYTGNPNTSYLSEQPDSTYTFDEYGLIDEASGGWDTEGLTFNVDDQKWEKTTVGDEG